MTDYLAASRALVRIDLHDEDSANYRWTDATLARHIAQAVKELSQEIPVENKTTLDATADSRDLSVSTLTGLIAIEAVEHPVGNDPKTYTRFSLWGTTLTLLGDTIPSTTGEDVYVYWHGPHTLSTSATTVPTWCDDLVALGAAALAAIEWASYATNRVNTGGDATWKQYLDWGNTNLAHFRSEIRRLGRRGSLRSATLYTPAEPKQSQTQGPGP